VVTNDAEVWQTIAVRESRPPLSAGEKSLMQRIKQQLDPLGTLPDILAAD
jgi:FAD/FMN-containing dehydrogenase